MKCPKCHSENTDTAKYCSECATSLPYSEDIQPSFTKTLETPIEELSRGTLFADRYEIIEELGKGGMGKVFRVEDKNIQEEVALKLIKPEIAVDEGMIERFRNELKMARKITHKNICRMYDLNEEDGTPYITMEYVSGEDLKSLIRKQGKLSEERTIAIARQVCEGLAAAHELGVVHRDLKPQNIMIDEKGNAKVMDFGIARSVEAAGVTATGMIIGTPDYISPEQVEGEEADQRSDIYALGVILFEMVIGSVPFKGDTAFSVALKHKTKLPSDPRKLNPEISENLSRLILVCMEKDRDRRYQTVEELLADLRNIEEGYPLGTKIRPRRETFVTTLIRKKLFIPALAVIAIVIAGVIIWQLLPLASAKFSIAVLPFEDLSPSKDQEYFCDGMAIELISRLTNIERLRVPARTSAFSFKGKGLDIREIGEKLEVENILEGSVRKAGNKLRITVQLVNVVDGYPLWSEKYEQDVEDIFALQDEISLAIIEKMKLKLLGEERGKLVKRHTENHEAYDSYMRGLYFWDKRTREGMKKGMEYFEKAIEKDPEYALAYVGLADSYTTLSYYGFLPPKDAYPKAKALAEKALEMDDTLAEIHTSLALISFVYDWEWTSAERGFKKAIELNPGYASAHHWYGLYLASVGRFDEAMVEMKRALELDPLSIRLQTELGNLFNWSGRSDEAIEQLRKTLEMDPNSGYVYLHFGHVYICKGMYEEAIAAYLKAIELGITSAVVNLGAVYAMSGERDKAEKILHELEERSKQEYVRKSHIARIYQHLGEIDKAFELLEKAYEERDSTMAFVIKTYPAFKNIRSDPRYTALLKKMGLE